jgi:hypothetical protein
MIASTGNLSDTCKEYKLLYSFLPLFLSRSFLWFKNPNLWLFVRLTSIHSTGYPSTCFSISENFLTPLPLLPHPPFTRRLDTGVDFLQRVKEILCFRQSFTVFSPNDTLPKLLQIFSTACAKRGIIERSLLQ